MALALEDLRDRFRRTFLGLLWIGLSFLVFVVVKNLVFSTLSDRDPAYFLTYMTVGFAIWTFMQSVLSDGVVCYSTSRSWILGTNLPYFLYICRFVYRCLIEFAIVGVTALAVCAVSGKLDLSGLLYVFLVLAFYVLTAFAAVMTLAPVGVILPDFVHAVRAAVRILFFATPIIWIPAKGTVLETVAFYNPFTHYIALMRAPLLGEAIEPVSFMIAGCTTLLLIFSGFYSFAVSRRTIAFLV